MRKPVNMKTTPRAAAASFSTMAAGGINRRELSQLLGVDVAQKMNNWLIDAQGQLFRSGEMSAIFKKVDWSKVTLFEHWLEEKWVIAYKGTANYELGIFDFDDSSLSPTYYAFTKGSVFNYATHPSPVSGQKYGASFYVGSSQDYAIRCYVIFKSMLNTVTTAFVDGETVTGSTSGATATVIDVNNTDTHLTVSNVSGTFVLGETITGSIAGDGVLTTDLYYTADSIDLFYLYVHSFIAPSGSSAGARLYLGSEKTDKSLLRYSDVDAGAFPPFAFNVTAAANTGGYIYNNTAGDLKAITSSGYACIVGYEDNNIGFTIETIDVGGVQTKITPLLFNDTDKGMAPGAISTSKGVFYGSEKNGFYQLVSGGAVGTPFSRNENKISLKLEKDYFEDVDMSSLSIAHVPSKNLVVFTYYKSSYSPADDVTHNAQFIYNTETGAISEGSLLVGILRHRKGNLYAIGSYEGTDSAYLLPATADTLEHDTNDGTYSSIVKIDSTHFAVAYKGTTGYGYVKTFSVDASYNIAQIDSFTFDSSGSAISDIAFEKISDEWHVLAFVIGATSRMQSIKINSSYIISTIASSTLFLGATGFKLLRLDDGHYAAAFTLTSGGIYIGTYSMSVTGFFANIDSSSTGAPGSEFSMENVDASHFAVAYKGGSGATIQIYEFDAYYSFTSASTLVHDASTGAGEYNSIQKTGDIYVLAYTATDALSVGKIKTFSIDSDYVITEAQILEHDSSNCTSNSLTVLSDGILALAYTGTAGDGYIKTFQTSTNGSILSQIQEYEHDTADAGYNSIIALGSDALALAYTGVDSDGFVKTLTIANSDNTLTSMRGNIFEVFSGNNSGFEFSQTTATFEQEVRPNGITGLFDVEKVAIQAKIQQYGKLKVKIEAIDEFGTSTDYVKTIDASQAGIQYGDNYVYEFEFKIPEVYRIKLSLVDEGSDNITSVEEINFIKLYYTDRAEEVTRNTITT